MKSNELDGDELVQIHEANGEVNAQVVRSVLKSYGIDSIIEGESIRLTHPVRLNKLGLVRILVRPQDAELAREILSSFQDSPAEE